MDRLFVPARMRQEPLISITWILALASIVGGFYIVSPFLEIVTPSATSAIFASAASTAGLALLGGASIVSGIMMIFGIKKNDKRWINHGLFLNFILRTYAILISLLVYGFQASVIGNLALLAIVLILFLVMRAPAK